MSEDFPEVGGDLSRIAGLLLKQVTPGGGEKFLAVFVVHVVLLWKKRFAMGGILGTAGLAVCGDCVGRP
jgi:hypothetical protein